MTREIKEVVSGNTVAVYHVSEDKEVLKRSVHSPSHHFTTLLKEIFLPQGYPGSVSADYTSYQIWDTLQELCSSLNGTLASHAVFKGMGVGDSEATALSATYTWLLRDGTGMIANILFAWSRGTLLDIDAKRWRLFADVVNDVAMFADLLSPLSPFPFTLTLCFTSVCRSLVGVAGGCTRAAIKQHQAIHNNTADVSAKDGSQEKLSNLLALLLSMTMIQLMTSSPALTWSTFSLLTVLHLYFNYRACSCLIMRSLNPSRYSILLQHWLNNQQILSQQYVNSVEPFILGIRNNVKCKVKLGSSLNCIKSWSATPDLYNKLASVPFIVYKSDSQLHVCLNTRSTQTDILAAFYIATTLTLQDDTLFIPSKEALTEAAHFIDCLSVAGWDVSFAPLGASDIRYICS